MGRRNDLEKKKRMNNFISAISSLLCHECADSQLTRHFPEYANIEHKTEWFGIIQIITRVT